MGKRRTRLAVAAGLFAAWIGWLAFLAATTTHPVVLSRPQFLVSNLYVIADLKGGPDHPEAAVTVREAGGPGAKRDHVAEALALCGLVAPAAPLLTAALPVVADDVAAGGAYPLKEGAVIEVINLPLVGPAQGWEPETSTRYILPLTRRGDGTFLVTPTPPSPGYPAAGISEADRLRIYPDNPRTLGQLRQIGW
jgi:hypothetical protein